MMGLPHDTDTEIPDSFFRPKMLQIKEATETNNQAELATTTHESQRKSQRTKTNPVLYSSAFNVPVTSLRGNDAYQKSVDSKKTVKVSKKKSGYRAEDDQLTSPITIKFCDYVFPISVDPDR